MPLFIQSPSIIKAAGKGEKIIQEYFGRINSDHAEVSIAKMNSPQGWEEPGQCPEFDEYTLVLKGTLQVNTRDGMYLVVAGNGILTKAGEWVQYSTPFAEGAEYIAICLPAFSNETVNRDNP